MKKEYDITIIDTGLAQEMNDDNETTGIAVKEADDDSIVLGEFDDIIGHGTAVYSIIKSHCAEARIFVIKLDCVTMESISPKCLIKALEYIAENIECRVVNISAGVKSYEFDKNLHKKISELVNQNICIVAAYDNDGTMSLPAAYDEVIGVSASKNNRNKNDYLYCEGSTVDILGYGGRQRLRWKNGSYIFNSGNSFACAHMSGIICRCLLDRKEHNAKNIRDILKEKAKEVLVFHKQNSCKTMPYIKKAAVFPVNKENVTLLRMAEKLDFEVIEVLDIRLSGNVGKSVGSIIEKNNLLSDKVVNNIDNFEYEGVDTLIIGHISELIRVIGNRLCFVNIVDKAVEKGIRVFAYDDLGKLLDIKYNYNDSVFWKEVGCNNYRSLNFEKMYYIHQPILGIFGTSSKQGKFTLQITLKNCLEKRGYRVGMLGTEPTSLLFGCDQEYPMGYSSNVNLKGQDAIQAINGMMHEISLKECDIIIVGGQSSVLPLEWFNIDQYPCRQYDYILGTHADAVILCVNAYDEIFYIRRTITYLESLLDCKVIALSLFPLTVNDDWTGQIGAKHQMTEEELLKKSEYLREQLLLPVFVNDEVMIELYADVIEDFFAEE